MAFPPRQYHAGYWYHVYSRHQRKGDLFSTDEDRIKFIEILDDVMTRCGAALGAFCLMDTHYHALMKMGEVDLGRITQTVHMRYAKYFNRSRDEHGNLFQQRPGIKIILEAPYLLQVIPYIHRNPLEAGLVEHPREYPWHSDGRYRGTETVYDWKTWEFPPGFSGEDRVQVYRERMNEPSNPDGWEGGEVYIGSEESWESLERRCEERSGEAVRERRGRRSMDELAEAAADEAGVTIEELKAPGRGKARSEARQNAMVMMYEAGYGPTEIGRYFNRTKSAVTYAVKKARGDF